MRREGAPLPGYKTLTPQGGGFASDRAAAVLPPSYMYMSVATRRHAVRCDTLQHDTVIRLTQEKGRCR